MPAPGNGPSATLLAKYDAAVDRRIDDSTGVEAQSFVIAEDVHEQHANLYDVRAYVVLAPIDSMVVKIVCLTGHHLSLHKNEVVEAVSVSNFSPSRRKSQHWMTAYVRQYGL